MSRQAQRTPDRPTSGLPDGVDRVEHAIYHLLSDAREQPPWAVHEIELEIGDAVAVEDALAHLHGAGLIHRLGGFAWISRAALRAEEIALD